MDIDCEKLYAIKDFEAIICGKQILLLECYTFYLYN